MLLTEFETLTGIYPDVNLYRVIEHEYNEGDWHDKAEFCTAYKFNEDGLATRLQMAANQRLIDMEEQHKRAVTNAANRAQKLCAENAKLAEDLENARKHDHMLQEHLAVANTLTPEKLYAPMMRALCTLYQDEVMPNELGMSAAAYCLLLDELEVRT